ESLTLRKGWQTREDWPPSEEYQSAFTAMVNLRSLRLIGYAVKVYGVDMFSMIHFAKSLKLLTLAPFYLDHSFGSEISLESLKLLLQSSPLIQVHMAFLEPIYQRYQSNPSHADFTHLSELLQLPRVTLVELHDRIEVQVFGS